MRKHYVTGKAWRQVGVQEGQNVTRAETLASLLSATCNLDVDITGDTWKDEIYDFALQNGLTTRSRELFEEDASVLRQDLFVMISRIADLTEQNGGCTDKVRKCRLTN